MRLLFDQNVSWRLVDALGHVYPGSTHVRTVGLASADDATVWEYARANGFTIVTKDAEFHQRSFLFGAPPKVVWIRRGNCSTDEIESLLRDRQDTLLAFERDHEAAFLALS